MSWRSFLFVVLFGGVVPGCGGSNATGPAANVATGPTSPVERYFPNTENKVYAYKTEDLAAGTSGVLVVRVRRRAGPGFELVGGARPQRLAWDAQGLRRAGDGTYLLRAPLEAGQTWPAGPGAQRRITAVAQSVRLAAGAFSQCVEVTEERTGGVQGKVVTTFCPDVGIVKMESQGTGENGSEIHERIELRSYGDAIDLSKGGPVPADASKAK